MNRPRTSRTFFIAPLCVLLSLPVMAQPLPTREIETNPIRDTYPDIIGAEHVEQWGPYNVHDPAILDDGEWFYSYSTDVSYGFALKQGSVQTRRSRDLVNWAWVGFAFEGAPPLATAYAESEGVENHVGAWAPDAIKVGDEYRLYYSQPGDAPMFASIGLLVGPTPTGPFRERGPLIVTSKLGLPMTNAIDPSIVVTPQGEHWMIYGSAFDGIYALQLDPETGLTLRPGDKGRRVAQRGVTDGKANGNIEGADIIYHPGFDRYYLFIAYDWLGTKYNNRVVRAEHPAGPYEDFTGTDANEYRDDLPMVLAPYRFAGHPGYQGVAHSTVFERDGQWFIANQGRIADDMHFMTMHVRKVYWTEDGWPVVSPQRYAGLPPRPVRAADLAGEWERIDFGYRVVPGYGDEQVDPDLQVSRPMTLDPAPRQTIDGDPGSRWSYDPPWLTLEPAGGEAFRVRIDRAWDWERQRETIIFTGLDAEAGAVWGKQREPVERE